METDRTLCRKRLRELADKACRDGRYLFTGFLSEAELADFYMHTDANVKNHICKFSTWKYAAELPASGATGREDRAFPTRLMEEELSHVPVTAFGGTADCERMMLRFGSRELCGYEEPFPIECVEIAPLTEKFGEELGHRDYLGALMNLGIDRSTLGDIVITGKHAFLFCTEKMAPYILENLNKVRHTNVKCSPAGQIPESAVVRLERKTIQVSAARIDSIIAKIYNLSRSASVELFRARKVFVNGRLCENNSGQPRPDDKVSVRGFGRFAFLGVSGETRKGKLHVEIDLYC